jgi:drug/metabolite transporter (DMT)-like permease
LRTQGAATRRTGKPTKKQTMAAADVTCGLAEVLVFIGALVAGTACSLCSKVLLSMRSVGASGEEQSFQNPLFQTWGMFLGMVFALPVHFAREALERRRSRRGYDAIGIERRPSFKEMPRSTYLLLAAPALFDLAATALCMFGLTRVAVSVYQMLRGAAIVFVAILKHFVLKDKLAKYMWVGVGLNVVSIVLVGATAQSSESGQGDPLVGVALILAGAFVQSLQYAFEEKVMSSDVGAPPLLVIGMEGFWPSSTTSGPSRSGASTSRCSTS